MKINCYSFFGILIILFLFTSYFIEIPIDEGGNYILTTKLLGVIIFHNPFILGIYLLISILLIIKSNKRKYKKN